MMRSMALSIVGHDARSRASSILVSLDAELLQKLIASDPHLQFLAGKANCYAQSILRLAHHLDFQFSCGSSGIAFKHEASIEGTQCRFVTIVELLCHLKVSCFICSRPQIAAHSTQALEKFDRRAASNAMAERRRRWRTQSVAGAGRT